MPDWMVPAAGLTGAVFVAIANYLVQRWRYRLDRVANSVDHLCEEINEVANLSTQYWLLDASDSGQQREAASIEPRLVGGQIRLQSLVLALGDLDRKLVLTRTEMLLVEFYEAITGGDFKVLKRAAAPDRAQMSQSLAAQINGELRHAVSIRSQLWG